MPAPLSFIGRSATSAEMKMLLPGCSTITLDQRQNGWQVESKWKTVSPKSHPKAYAVTPGEGDITYHGALRLVYEWAWDAYIDASPGEACPHNWDEILGPVRMVAIVDVSLGGASEAT